jgi:type II secretory pathway pseudopilin PulG
MKNSKGFSLIELMVGIAIIITSTTIVLSIIVSSFRISNKNNSADTVRQNGNYAISKISRTVQFAESFVATSVNGSTFTPACTDGVSYRAIRLMYQDVSTTVTCSNDFIRVNGNPITANNIDVVNNTCIITCERDLDSTPVVGIEFSLQRGGSNTSGEQTSRIDFSTKVKMRNE